MTLIEQVKSKLIDYDKKDIKRISHALKVHSFAKYIAEGEGVEKNILQTLEIASLLHDIGIHISEEKYGSSAGKYQEIEGPAIAEELMKGMEISEIEQERVKYLISRHHTYHDIDCIDYQILVEADFIVNIDEDNIPREAIEHTLKTVFRTETGIDLVNSLYL